MDGVRVFVDYLFATYSFDKLYIESPAFTLPDMKSIAPKYAIEEGVLREHEHFLGQKWDVHIFAMYRHNWERVTNERDRRQRRGLDLRADEEAGVTEEEFLEFVAGELAVERPLNLELRITQDLELDSLGIIILVECIESLGSEISYEAIAGAETLGDLYVLYLHNRR